MTKTVYTDRTYLNYIDGNWDIVEFDGTDEQLSNIVTVEHVFRIKDIALSTHFCGYMNLNNRIYDLKDTEGYFYNTPVILKGAPGNYIPRHGNTDLFFVKTSDPHFLQHMLALPDDCKYMRVIHLAHAVACLIDDSGVRFMDVTKFGTCEISSRTPTEIKNRMAFMHKEFHVQQMFNNHERSVPNMNRIPEIENVIFNPPATIVFWKDGTKTVVKCGDMDLYSRETGLAMCIAKKVYGNKGNYFNEFKKWIKPDWNFNDDAAYHEMLKIINKTRNCHNDKNTANDIVNKMNPDSIIPIYSLTSDEAKFIKRLCKLYLEAMEN